MVRSVSVTPIFDLNADTLGAVGSAVSSWADSASGRTFTQGTANLQPPVVAGPNGHKAVQFNARWLASAAATPAQTALTVVLVMRLDSIAPLARSGLVSAASAASTNDYDAALGGWALGNPTSTSETTFTSLSGSGAVAADARIKSSSQPLTQWVVLTAAVGTDGGLQRIYTNGAVESGSPTSVVRASGLQTGRLWLGARYYATPTDFGRFSLTRAILYPGRLSDTDRAAAHSNMADAYTITTSDYVPEGTPPKAGSATGTWATASAVSGQRTPKGAAASTWSTSGAASGRRQPKGTATGAWSTAGAATGKTPGAVVPPNKGGATGTWTTASTATGRRTPKGRAAGTWSTSGAATGPNAYVANPNDPDTIIAGDDGAPNLAIEVQPDYGTGTFVWDVSEWDGLDLLAWGSGSDGWQNVVCDVTSVSIKRGMDRAGGLTDVAAEGTCSVTLTDTDRRFDPTANADAIHAGTPFRIRAWSTGWSEVLFTGRIGQGADGLQVSYSREGAPTVTLLATDRVMPLAGWKSAGREDPGVGGGDNLLTRLGRVLAELGWPANIIATDVDTAYSATLASNVLASAWDVVADATEAELGRLWVDRHDRLVVRARGSQLSGPVRGTLSDVHDEIVGGTVHCCYDDAQVVYGTELLANRAVAARRVPDPGDDAATPVPSAVAQVDDQYSQARYGVGVVSMTSLELDTDSQLLPWAQAVVLEHTEPELRVNNVTPAPFNAPASWPAVAGTDIGDRWSFRLRPQVGPAVARTLGVLGISHDITPDEWVVTWITETAPTPGDNNPSGWFTWDLSDWDGDDLLAPIGGTVTS